MPINHVPPAHNSFSTVRMQSHENHIRTLNDYAEDCYKNKGERYEYMRRMRWYIASSCWSKMFGRINNWVSFAFIKDLAGISMVDLKEHVTKKLPKPPPS